MRRALMVFLMAGVLAGYSAAMCADAPLYPMYDKRITFPPASDLFIPSLSNEQRAKLKAYQSSLSASVPDAYSLKGYQTPVKSQNPRGSCVAHAFLGAVEAYYVRAYGLNYANVHYDGPSKYQKYFITNDCSLYSSKPGCCEEFDLSEEYLIHIVHSTQPTNNPNVSHENILSFWSGDAKDMSTSELCSANALCLPREGYAPYFGDANATLDAYGTKHGHNDLGNIAKESGILTVTVNGYIWANGDFFELYPDCLPQEAVDNFEYDTRHIPLEARKNAIYRPTSVQQLSSEDAQDVDDIEKYLANDHEVEIHVGLGKLDFGDTVYYDNTPVEKHPDGTPIARYPVTPPWFVDCTAPGCKGLWEGYDDQGDYYESAHAMLIVAYDRPRQLFLLKNSWGNTCPYIWVPYQFIEEKAHGGLIILDVRDPGDGPSPEAMWIGKWVIDNDGHMGELVIRRTRPVDQPDSYVARIGSYYGADGVPHMVTGFVLDPNQIYLWIDFDNTEPPTYAKGTEISLAGREFELAVYCGASDQFTCGNFAAGTTTWNGTKFGTLLRRENVNMPYASGSFSMEKWKDRFRLFYDDGCFSNFEVLRIGSLSDLGYYPVYCRLNQSEGTLATIDKNQPHRLSFDKAYAPGDVYYHTWETGIVSGFGVFGLPAMETPTYTGVFSYDKVDKPVLDPEEAEAKPCSVYRSTSADTLSFEIGLLPFSEPVDIYLGVSCSAWGSEICLITPQMTLQPLSAGLVKWKGYQTAPVDEKLFQNIPVGSLPQGVYRLYTLVTPGGSSIPYYLWVTRFDLP
jgi:hypothetical protein